MCFGNDVGKQISGAAVHLKAPVACTKVERKHMAFVFQVYQLPENSCIMIVSKRDIFWPS